MKEEKDLDFVASHYKRHRFAADHALKRMGLATTKWWHKSRIAAAAATLIVIGATAGIVITRQSGKTSGNETEIIPSVQTHDIKIISIIDFDEAPLTDVIAKIEATYGVTIINIPEDASELRLTIHYEGTAEDLLETVNDILNTDMEIESR